jgi:hypothetical protein
MLQQIDDWIAEGVLGGQQLNAADFHVATCLRLAMSLEDLHPAIEHRPEGEPALRVVPDYPGRIPPVLAAAWLEAPRAAACPGRLFSSPFSQRIGSPRYASVVGAGTL